MFSFLGSLCSRKKNISSPEHKYQTIERQILNVIEPYKLNKRRASIEMQYLIEFAKKNNIEHKPLDAKELTRLVNLLNRLHGQVKDKKNLSEALKLLFDNPLIQISSLDSSLFSRPIFKLLEKQPALATMLAQVFQKLDTQHYPPLRSRFTNDLLYKFPEYADILATQIIAIRSPKYIQAYCIEMLKKQNVLAAVEIRNKYQEMYRNDPEEQKAMAIAAKAARLQQSARTNFLRTPKHSPALLRSTRASDEKKQSATIESIKLELF